MLPNTAPIPVGEARRLLREACPQWGTERLPLSQCAGRVLMEPLHADRPWPPFHRVMMDGVALCLSGISTSGWLKVEAVQAAGDPPIGLQDAANCIEVMTGAVLPPGCDCVVPVEELERGDMAVRLRPGVALHLHQHVHAAGHDARAGELLLQEGSLLKGPALAVAASVGAQSLQVARHPDIVVLATGKEVVGVASTPQPWQIRGSNGPALGASLELAGFPALRHATVGDEWDEVSTAVDQALEESDMLVLSGAVSQGRHDHVPAVLERAGCRLLFHGVAQRPGKPMLAALKEGARPCLVLALPGNPVSALCALHSHLLPLLRWRIGLPSQEAPVLLDVPVPRHPRFTLFLPARLEVKAQGQRNATLVPTANSGDFLPLARAQGVVELAPGADEHQPEDPLIFHPWS